MFKNIILYIFSHLLIFAITDDNTFLYKERSKNNHYKPRYRFSVINLLIGEIIIQFLTVTIVKKKEKNRIEFKIYRVQKLSEIELFKLKEDIVSQLKKEYRNHLKSISEEKNEISIEKESLLRHLSREENRIDISYNKINVYLSVMLVIVPLLIGWADYKSLFNERLSIKIVFILLAYALTNICAFVLQSIGVGKYAYSSFKDLKKSRNKVKEHNWQIYYDWQQTRRKADMYVSFVINIQQWVITTIVLFVVLKLLLVMNVSPKAIVSSNQVYTVSLDSINNSYSNSAYTWHYLLSQINTDDYDEIIVIYNANDIDEIFNKLDGFSHQKVTWVIDEKMDKNELKIIMENSKWHN